MARIALLDTHDPTPAAFTFRPRFAPPNDMEAGPGEVPADDRDACSSEAEPRPPRGSQEGRF